MTTEVLLVLTLERVASRAQTFRENFGVPARAMHHYLSRCRHSELAKSNPTISYRDCRSDWQSSLALLFTGHCAVPAWIPPVIDDRFSPSTP